jgi:BASS family bile acid:Na+ symporter
MTLALLIVLKVSISAIIFAIGLASSPHDLTYFWRHPAQFFRAVLAMYVAVPLVALLLAKWLPLSSDVETAMLMISISAGAPLLPRKLTKQGRGQYGLSLAFTTSLLATVTVPCWLSVLDPLFGRESAVEPRQVALVIAKAFLAPLLAGMVLRVLIRKLADRWAELLLSVAGATLALSGIALLVSQWRLIAGVGWVAILALAGMSLAALIIGHFFGGPDPGDRTALAVSCTARNVGIAVLAASTMPKATIVPLVLAYLVASALVSLPYLKWRGSGAASASVA